MTRFGIRPDRDRPAAVRAVAHVAENTLPQPGSALGSGRASGPALWGLSDFQNTSSGLLPAQGACGTSKGSGGLLLRKSVGRHVRGTGATGNLAGLGVSRGMGGLVRGEDAGATPGCQNERPGGAQSQLLGGAMMIQITPQMRILVAVEPVDFRCGIDGLAQLCRQRLQDDPFSGCVFVFRGPTRHGDQGAGLRRTGVLAVS